MKKREYIIIAAILIIAIVAAVFLKLYKSEGTTVCISLDGSEYASFSLYENRTVEIITEAGTNIVAIYDGKVRMESADCPNQLCVNMLPLSEGDSDLIVCMPHGIVISIK